MNTETVLSAYLEGALWASTDDAGEPLDGLYSPDDIAPESLARMRADVEDFLALCERERIDLGDMSEESFGHDFWLTRNRHGAGFWDRGIGETGERLTTLAHAYGSADLYVGDDGSVYHA